MMNTCMRLGIVFMISILGFSCSNKEEEIDQLLSESIQTDVEYGKNIRIIYSDSAMVKAVVYAPVLERKSVNGKTIDEFPKGILLEFLNDQKTIYSHLKADHATRDERSGLVVAKGNVVFYNDKNEKIETPELIWEEKERKVYTEKIVRITQAEKGDTTYGIGFSANQEFTRFEIKKKVQGKLNVGNLFGDE
jgi:LPS export ABC transporter protein LptC